MVGLKGGAQCGQTIQLRILEVSSVDEPNFSLRGERVPSLPEVLTVPLAWTAAPVVHLSQMC